MIVKRQIFWLHGGELTPNKADLSISQLRRSAYAFETKMLVQLPRMSIPYPTRSPEPCSRAAVELLDVAESSTGRAAKRRRRP